MGTAWCAYIVSIPPLLFILPQYLAPGLGSWPKSGSSRIVQLHSISVRIRNPLSWIWGLELPWITTHLRLYQKLQQSPIKHWNPLALLQQRARILQCWAFCRLWYAIGWRLALCKCLDIDIKHLSPIFWPRTVFVSNFALGTSIPVQNILYCFIPRF